MRKMKLNVKVVAAFIAGAALAGSIATAAITPTAGTLKACADNRTQALFLSTTGTCSSSRTLVEIGGNGMNTKTISSLVTPSVVSISATTANGGGTGSGSIYKSNSSSSYIITNNHVIEAAATTGTIKVELTNGEQYTAKIVGRDPGYDIAVLQIQIGNLPAIALGDSSKVSVGDPVLAIGSPLGLSGTVTTGIISAKNRPVTAGDSSNESSFINALQTDAAINPGNSGGPLVDSTGAVIGVNSAIASLGSDLQTGSIGLGFAIPINQARKTADQLIKNGVATYPVIGISLDMNYAGEGAQVATSGRGILAGSPAQKAGLRGGDIVIALDGQPINGPEELIVAVRSKNVGDVVKLTYKRDGSEKTVTLTLIAAKK